MSDYNSNYEIAQAISERIGNEPIPFDSVYEISLQIYNELGGEPAEFDSVYEILLGILPLAAGGSSPFDYDSSNGSISNKAFSPEGQTYTNSATGQNAITLGQGNTVSGEGSATIGGQGCSVTGDVSASVGGYNNTVSGSYAVILGGQSNTATKSNTCVIGRNNNATGTGSFAMGRYSNAEGDYSVAGGQGITTIPNRAIGKYSNVSGACVLANNDGETALGFANRSHKASATRGDAGNTLFSVGDLASNTITDATRENAFEIMQNGDVYVKGVGGYQGTDTKVQDATIKTLQEAFSGKSDKIAATVTYDESTDTYDFSNLNSITEVGEYNIIIEHLNSTVPGGQTDIARLSVASMGGGMAVMQFITIFNQNVTTSSLEYFMKIRVGMGGRWQEYPSKIFIAAIDDSTATTTSTYSSTKIESLISALNTRIAALENA